MQFLRTEKMKTALLLLACWLATVSCGRGGYREAIESCNKYIDDMLKRSVSEGGTLDPFQMNDTILTFQKKILFVDFKGEAKLSQGSVIGLGSLRRVTPCTLTFEYGRLKLGADLKTETVFFNSTGSAKMMNMGSVIHLHGNVSSIDINMGFSIDYATGKETLLDEFEVDEMKSFLVYVEGLRLANWWSEQVRGAATLFFRSVVRNLIEITVKETLTYKMIENPFPIKDFEIDTGDIVGTTKNLVLTTTDTTEGKTKYLKEDSNSYIDSVLENRFIFEAHYSKLDPYELKHERIDDAYILDKKEEKNYIELGNGRLMNLGRIKRISDCDKPVFKESNITFNCYLGLDDLEARYSALAFKGNDISDFELLASITDTRIGIKITTDFKDNIPNLKDFKINNIGQFTVKAAKLISGPQHFAADTPFNKLEIVRHFTLTLMAVLNGRFKEVLSYSVYKTPIHFLQL